MATGDAVERVLPAAEDREHQRADQQHELEFPPGRVRFLELAMDFGGEERDRAEHHDDESEAGELGEEAEDQPQRAGGFGDREDAEVAQHAGGHLRGRLSAPQALLWQAVEEKDGAEGEAEDEESEVRELVERGEKAHGMPPYRNPYTTTLLENVGK